MWIMHEFNVINVKQKSMIIISMNCFHDIILYSILYFAIFIKEHIQWRKQYIPSHGHIMELYT